MNMGLPPDEESRATFVFPRVVTAVGGELDHTGVPLSPDARVTAAPARKVQVPCGVEHGGGASGDPETSIGRFGTGRVTITLLDEDYAQVKGFQAVLLGGVPYYFVRELPPSGLGAVGVHQLECRTEAEA